MAVRYLSGMRILSALWFAACLGCGTGLQGQEIPRVRIHVAPSIEVPLGAWREDYGNSAKLRVRGDVSLNARAYVWAEYGARFGGGVRNTNEILGFLMNEDGYIMGNDGSPALIRLEGRGSSAALGYGHRLWMSRAHSLAAEAGLDALNHRIWFNNSGGVPLLTKPYVYGLDRMRQGLGVQAALRYSHADPEDVVNFSLSQRAGVAQTHDVRGTHYGANPPSPTPQWDAFVGAELSWFLPLGGKLSTANESAPNQPRVRYYQ